LCQSPKKAALASANNSPACFAGIIAGKSLENKRGVFLDTAALAFAAREINGG